MKEAIYISTSGKLKRDKDTICFERENGKRYLPVENINELHVFGEVELNKRFLEFICQQEIIIHFYNYYGYYTGSFYPREHLNSGYMTVKQAEYYLQGSQRLLLAKRFVEGAYKNIRQVLTYYQNRGKSLEDTLTKIDNLGSALYNCKTTEELMALEGNIRDLYYRRFDNVIDDPNFVFEGRSRQPPQNQLNAMISFGNTLLYTTVLSEIYRTHLDPRIGFLHTSNFRRFSLNLDIAEIFKPVIVDRLIFSLLSRQKIDLDCFEKKMGGILFNEKGRNKFITEYDNKLSTTIQHRQLKRKVSYRRLIRMELYKLEKHLLNEKEFQAFVSKW